MNLREARELLVLIESYDRRPFRPEAVDLWFAALRSVTAEDATAAVHQIFRISGHNKDGDIRKLLPADVLRPAQAIGEARRRQEILAAQRQAAAQRRAIEAGPTGRAEPAPVGLVRSAAAEAAIAAARARVSEAEAQYREAIAA